VVVDDWFEAMRRADFAAAWRISDRILAERNPAETCWHLARHEQWVWDGRPLANQRVLVRCYHGLGDTIQFARCLPMLDGVARESIVWVQPEVLGLLRAVPGQRQLLPLHDGTPDVEYDVDIEIMELGHALRISADSVGTCVPYLHVEPAQRPSANFNVGLVAATGDWDGRRSIPDELLSSLSGIAGVELLSLQLQKPLPRMRDWSTPDALELARRVRALDLVIAPDTMVVHLAGALAVPTWTLLPQAADWRWHQPHRADSPWYPTMRLFRQPRPGDWASVIENVAANLRSAVNA
jgi:hypothetical protein